MWKVMAADDEAYMRTALQKLMNWEKIGCELLAIANNGKDLIERIEEEHPDIVVTDIRMPEADGIEVCRYIYENHPDIQVIILSAYTDFEYARAAIRYDVCEYVLKISLLEELPGAVEKVIRNLEKRRRDEAAMLEAAPHRKDADSLYQQILLYIDQNYEKKITLNEMAGELHANSSYLSRLFKKESGINLIDAILKRRVEKAKEYMNTTDWKVYEISQAVGFEDTGYFSRIFKRYAGVSPKEYKNGKKQISSEV